MCKPKCPDTTYQAHVHVNNLGTINDQRVFDDVYGCGNLPTFPGPKIQECGSRSNYKVHSRNLITVTDYDCGVDPNEVSDSNDPSQPANGCTVYYKNNSMVQNMIHYVVVAIHI